MLPLLDNIFDAMNRHGASDVYLTVKQPPILRVQDKMIPMELSPLSAANIDIIITTMLNDDQLLELERTREMNVSFGVGGKGRYRVNIYYQRQTPSLVIRHISYDIPTFDDLGIPEMFKDLVMTKRGLVLLVGMTGAGKSTTLAAMIDHRNETSEGHIITIEDPVEYLHKHKRSLVSQREVGLDTESYHNAIKNAFRQKPDVILIGEIRDTYVMEQALVAAETGHLCLSTLHANNAYQAIERILNFFDDTKQKQARMNLALNLRAIVAQRLVRSVDGGRVLALEVLLNEGLIRELILKGDTARIRDVIAENKTAGMMTFDQSLYALYQEGNIDAETAIAESDGPVDMKLNITRNGKQADKKGIDTSKWRI